MIALQTLVALDPPPHPQFGAPPRPAWWHGMTREQIEDAIREKLRAMPDLPFSPETARIELPAFVADTLKR